MRSYSINLKNFGITEFSAHDFNSYCTFRGKTIGANSGGLYYLQDGILDDLSPVTSSVTIGYITFKTLTRFLDSYLELRGSGDFTLTIITEDGTSTVYDCSVDSTMPDTVKTNLSKGQMGKFYTVQISCPNYSQLTLLNVILNTLMTDRGR